MEAIDQASKEAVHLATSANNNSTSPRTEVLSEGRQSELEQLSRKLLRCMFEGGGLCERLVTKYGYKVLKSKSGST